MTFVVELSNSNFVCNANSLMANQDVKDVNPQSYQSKFKLGY